MTSSDDTEDYEAVSHQDAVSYKTHNIYALESYLKSLRTFLVNTLEFSHLDPSTRAFFNHSCDPHHALLHNHIHHLSSLIPLIPLPLWMFWIYPFQSVPNAIHCYSTWTKLYVQKYILQEILKELHELATNIMLLQCQFVDEPVVQIVHNTIYLILKQVDKMFDIFSQIKKKSIF